MHTSNILVTGAAGFIGYHVCRHLLDAGHVVTGLDIRGDASSDPIYRDRLKALGITRAALYGKNSATLGTFTFHRCDINDLQRLQEIFEAGAFNYVIHLAARAGVRESVRNPLPYVTDNIHGLISLLECCKAADVKHVLLASSSSVYGLQQDSLFSESLPVDSPISVYAATKRSGELIAHSYAHLHGLPVTCVRFFTVYGPWNRTDMAAFTFTRAIDDGETIRVYNEGDMQRDFTYVEDVAEGLQRLLKKVPEGETPYRILNLSGEAPVNLMDFIRAIEQALGKEAKIEYAPMQPGDMHTTAADTHALQALIGPLPRTPLETGVRQLVSWYRTYISADSHKAK